MDNVTLIRVAAAVVAVVLLAIVIVSILGPGLFNAMLAVVVVTLPGYTRLSRASALSEMARDYVTATRCAPRRRHCRRPRSTR